jgi:hypothetical protein
MQSDEGNITKIDIFSFALILFENIVGLLPLGRTGIGFAEMS